MARLPEKEYTYFQTVRGMCRQCRRIVPARVFFRNEQVWQQSLCPDCNNEPVMIAAAKNWYMSSILKTFPDHSPLQGSKPQRLGCPHDCGPCSWHASPIKRYSIKVAHACNPKNSHSLADGDKGNFYIPIEEVTKSVNRIMDLSGEVDTIDIVGDEPLLHPAIIAIIRACKRPQIKRLTINSNGVLLTRDYALCQQVAELAVEVVLGCNTLDRQVSKLLHGENITDLMLKAIDNLGRAGAKIALMSELIMGVNEDIASDVLDLMCQHNHILSAAIQTKASSDCPVDRAAQIVCRQSKRLKLEDFMASPSAHPLCYLVCLMSKKGSVLEPFVRFEKTDKIEQLLNDGFDDGNVRTLSIHAPMQEGNFDCSRAMLCPEMLAFEGGLMPACMNRLRQEGGRVRNE